jgi:hypothetical protein
VVDLPEVSAVADAFDRIYPVGSSKKILMVRFAALC